MLISLSEIMTTKDKVAHIQAPIELEAFTFQDNTYEFAKKDMASLIITNLGSKTVMIEGSTNISLSLYCDRCLKKMTYPMELHFSKEIDFKQTDEERARGMDETNYITGYDLDVDILIHEEILMGFPAKLLCSADCKGICKTCGVNQNDETCSCDNSPSDPRMSVIRDIFNNFKEV